MKRKILITKEEKNIWTWELDVYKRQRFYQHYGIDPISLVRAIRNNLRAKALIEGGSTITQQLAKNLYFDDEASLVRKAAEAMVTVVLEERYSKDEILELYVNCIYFGESYYCVYDASIGYFQKIPSQMTDFEATMLAGIPNAPSAYAPTVNMNLAVKRPVSYTHLGKRTRFVLI